MSGKSFIYNLAIISSTARLQINLIYHFLMPFLLHVFSNRLSQHWTNLWVVLRTEISPATSFIAYCKKEEDWLINQKTVAKCFLGNEFTVKPAPPDYSKKFSRKVLQLTFPSYRLDLAFDSMTKMDQWCKALQMLSGMCVSACSQVVCKFVE